MTDENDKPDEESRDAGDAPPIGGERLRKARRKQQIPVLEIAKELHLDEYKVRALERNEFDVLGAPVFAKGHLRKYAQLVGVPADDVMADYYQLNRSESTPLLVATRKRPQRELSPGPWVAAIVLLIAAAAAYWWFIERQTAIPEIETEELREDAPADETAAPVTGNIDLPVAVETIDEPPPEAVSAVVETVAEPVVETAADVMRMSITYSGDCWTEISDAGGRRLFFDLGRSGRRVNLSGEPPFNVLFGDADNVSLEVNGAPFNIAAANRRGKTARLTISGS